MFSLFFHFWKSEILLKLKILLKSNVFKSKNYYTYQIWPDFLRQKISEQIGETLAGFLHLLHHTEYLILQTTTLCLILVFCMMQVEKSSWSLPNFLRSLLTSEFSKLMCLHLEMESISEILVKFSSFKIWSRTKIYRKL